MSNINDDFIKKVFDGALKDGQVHDGYYFDVAGKLTEAISKGLKIKGLTTDSPQTKMFEKFRNNIYAFSAAKSLTLLQEYNKALVDEGGNRRSFGAFKNAAIPVGEQFNNDHLRTEYNSATAKAQMGAKWDRLKGYDMLEYRTVGDNKVRKKHAELHGLRLPPDHPLWRKIYPPNDWGCRCTVIPAQGQAETNSEIAKQYADSPALKPYFRQNSGIEHVAFNEDQHPYFAKLKQFKTGLLKQVELMAEENYAMQPVEKIVARHGLPVMKTASTKEEALQQWSEAPRKATSVDGIQWDLKDRWGHVVDHNSGDERWKYINNVTDVLQGADEVWTSNEANPDGSVSSYKRYVKYYKGQPVVFSYPVDRPDDWTMYQADLASSGKFEKMRKDVRRGVLIYRK